MPKINPYYIKNIDKLPETATVSYYNAETDENLTAEEWRRLHPEVNPSEVRIINQGEVYQSWKADVDYPAYGPMNFGDETALMIVKSASIMNRLSRDYPTIVRLFEGNRGGTMNFLKANSAFSVYRASHEFYVGHSGERDGVKVWSDYGRKIDDYVDELCRRMRDSKGQSHYEQLRPASPVLAGEIYREYYNRFPYWPSVSQREQSDSVEINASDSHVYYVYHIVWSCVGRVFVKDTRPDYNTYKAEFSGSPEIKILELDYDKLKELEGIVSQRSFSEAEKMICDRDRTRDPRLLTWDSLK